MNKAQPIRARRVSRFRIGCFILVAAYALFPAGCSNPAKPASEEIDFGTLNGSVYHNNYFNLTATLPSEWNYLDLEARQRMMNAGVKLVAGQDKNLSATLKAGELQTVNLLSAFKHKLGAPVPFNPSVQCIAERVRHMPGIERGKDYQFHAKKLLQAGQMKFTFPKDTTTETLGGASFDVMYMELSLPTVTVRQKYYTTIMNGYALTFIVSFSTEEEETVLLEVLKTVSFN
jgi:hypothetical protein